MHRFLTCIRWIDSSVTPVSCITHIRTSKGKLYRMPLSHLVWELVRDGKARIYDPPY
jgi:hypothetical protein